MCNIKKIVITGGPCAGKTTAMKKIKEVFSGKGYTVLFIAETATELINGGVAPWTCANNIEYQRCQMYLQLAKENVFVQAAETMPTDKILIVLDRGMVDNKAYMGKEAFEKILEELQLSEKDAMDAYDAVFHLTTAAKGAEDAYTLSNNEARTESIEEARIVDDKLLAAWEGHPCHRILDNSTDFEGKLQRLIAEINEVI